MRNDVEQTPFNWLEPITTLAALAMETSRIGLIATASTTYTEPYNLARQFCSLDQISGGRIGWNIVTIWSPQAGGNFGGIGQVSHADRYERAEEYMTVVKGLLDPRPESPPALGKLLQQSRLGNSHHSPASINPYVKPDAFHAATCYALTSADTIRLHRDRAPGVVETPNELARAPSDRSREV